MPFNSPNAKNFNSERIVEKWVHQPLTIEHFGIHASIKENGRVVIQSNARPIAAGSDEVEYDEVEVPASLIFKLATYLKDTRKPVQVKITRMEEQA